jgi:hypothetical protein
MVHAASAPTSTSTSGTGPRTISLGDLSAQGGKYDSGPQKLDPPDLDPTRKLMRRVYTFQGLAHQKLSVTLRSSSPYGAMDGPYGARARACECSATYSHEYIRNEGELVADGTFTIYVQSPEPEDYRLTITLSD